MDDPTDWEIRYGQRLRSVALWSSTTLSALSCLGLLYLFVRTDLSVWQDLIKAHFLGTVGLIGIQIASIGTVTFLRQSEGAIEFEGWGFKFKGASGQVVLWGFCVVVLSLCAKMLWDAHS